MKIVTKIYALLKSNFADGSQKSKRPGVCTTTVFSFFQHATHQNKCIGANPTFSLH